MYEDQQQHMMDTFAAAMAKLAVLGQDVNSMVDCSDVIPVPKPNTKPATFPAGLSNADVEQAVSLIRYIPDQPTDIWLSAPRHLSPLSTLTPAPPLLSHLCKFHSYLTNTCSLTSDGQSVISMRGGVSLLRIYAVHIYWVFRRA